MAFFAGVAQAVQEWDDQRYQDKVRREQRDYDSKVRSEDRRFSTSERLAGQRFTARENELTRQFQIDNREDTQDFNIEVLGISNDFQVQRDAANRAHESEILSSQQNQAINMLGREEAFKREIITTEQNNYLARLEAQQTDAIELQNNNFAHSDTQLEEQFNQDKWKVAMTMLDKNIGSAKANASERAARISSGASVLGDREVAAAFEASGQLSLILETIKTNKKNGSLDPRYIPNLVQAVRTSVGSDNLSQIASQFNKALGGTTITDEGGVEIALSRLMGMSAESILGLSVDSPPTPSIPSLPTPTDTSTKGLTVDNIRGIKTQIVDGVSDYLNSFKIVQGVNGDASYTEVTGADPKTKAEESYLLEAATDYAAKLRSEVPLETAIGRTTTEFNMYRAEGFSNREIADYFLGKTQKPEKVEVEDPVGGTDTPDSSTPSTPEGMSLDLFSPPEPTVSGIVEDVVSGKLSLEDARSSIATAVGKETISEENLSRLQEELNTLDSLIQERDSLYNSNPGRLSEQGSRRRRLQEIDDELSRIQEYIRENT